jgi:hypothetical protein
MAFYRSDLISRRGYSGFGGIWDTLTGGAGSVLTSYGQLQQQQGAASQAQKDLATAVSAQGDSNMTLILGAAAVGLVAIMLLKKKKPAAQ